MKCDICKFWIIILSIIVMGFVVAYQFVPPPPPEEICIATGREGGGYYVLALEYQKLLVEQGIKLDIKPTAGSSEALELLKSGEVSVAFIQGGTVGNTVHEGIGSLASLFYEPLWIFYRKEQPINYLFDLQGKRLAIGEDGSGTQLLALQLLQGNYLTENNTTFLDLSDQIAVEQLGANKIDAVFLVTSVKNPLLDKLLKDPQIELLSIKRDMAYRKLNPFLTKVEIGEGMIDLGKNIPHEYKILLAATTSLVARGDIHPDITRLLLRAATKIHSRGGLFEKQEMFPSVQFVELPLNKEARRYLQSGPSFFESIFPFWLASLLVRLKVMLLPLLTLVFPLMKGAMPLYRWRIRSKIFRWYKILHEIDLKVEGLSSLVAIEREIEHLNNLQDEIVKQVSVPLSYMSEFYVLRGHIDLIISKLKKKRDQVIC